MTTSALVISIILAFTLLTLTICNGKAESTPKSNRTKLKDFTESKVIKDETTALYFAVDEGRQEIFCSSREKKIRFKYQDIVTAEIKADGEVLVTNKSVSLKGALVGGFFGGKLGAVIGGSSMGPSETTKRFSSLYIHVLLRDCDVTSFDIHCLSEEREQSAAQQNAQDIFDILQLAMDKLQQSSSPRTAIEELKDLAELKQQGLITDEEFAELKSKIISK